MTNAKTKFIIAVTQRLAAAPDSDAKVELIEELSENLYSRYQDMVSGGMPEAEAYEKALGELGDVEELLAYLDGAAPGGAWAQREGGFVGFADDILEQVRGAARSAMDLASEAIDAASDRLRDISGRERRRPSDDDFPFDHEDEGEVTVPSESLCAVNVTLADGDVTVTLDSDAQGPVRITGDTEELELRQSGDGTLFIRQGRTASGSFFFGKMLRSTDIELHLPARHWDGLTLSTASGDVEIGCGLDAGRVDIKTASGDVDIAGGLHADRVNVVTASGDLNLREAVCGQLVFKSASGDFDGDGISAGSVELATMSGDIQVFGALEEVCCATASGDAEVSTTVLPWRMEVSSKSGDCAAAVPDGAGFTVQFSTVSGELYSDFPLTGPVGGRSGKAVYLDGGDSAIQLSSVSGDISLRRQPG